MGEDNSEEARAIDATQDTTSLRDIIRAWHATPRHTPEWEEMHARYRARATALDRQLRFYSADLYSALEAGYGAALDTALAETTWDKITWRIEAEAQERKDVARWLQAMPIIFCLTGHGIDGWFPTPPFDWSTDGPVMQRLLGHLQQESTTWTMRQLLTWIATPHPDHAADPEYYFDAVFFVVTAMEVQGMSREMQCLYFFRHLPYERFEEYYNVSMEIDSVWNVIADRLPGELREILEYIHGPRA